MRALHFTSLVCKPSTPKPQRAPDGASVHYERHRPEQTALYRLVQQHAATFFVQAEGAARIDQLQFVEDEFDTFLECGILAHGFLCVRCRDFGHDKLFAHSCKGRGSRPSRGDQRMAQMAAHLIDHVIHHVPVRQWVPSLPTTLSLLLAAQRKLVTPVLSAVHRVITQHLLGQMALKATVSNESRRPVSRFSLKWVLQGRVSSLKSVGSLYAQAREDKARQGKARQGVDFYGFNDLAQKMQCLL